MTFFILGFLILVAAGIAVYVIRASNATDPLLVSTRIGRYGLVHNSGGEDSGAVVSEIMSPQRERQQQSAVSQSVERFVGRGRVAESVFKRLDRAHIKMTAAEFLTLNLAALVGGMAAGLFIRGFLGLLILGTIGAVGPWLYLKRRTAKRHDKFLEQLADMTQMMANSMKAGFSILQSMELVGKEGGSPADEEFERVVTEVKLGLSIEQALEHLRERMPSEDVELMVVAIIIQRQIGGNLAGILLVISQTIRERVRFQRDVRTLTAAGRYSSYIITALPVAVGAAINFLDREYESFLYTNTLGNFMIGTALVMLALGFYFLRRIANIEV